MIRSPRLFRARSLHIVPPAMLEVEVDLDFGITRRTFISVAGMPEIPRHLQDRAKHALIVLCGGKNLIVKPKPDLRPRWHSTTPLECQVYYPVTLPLEPIGYIAAGVAESRGPVLEVGPYLTHLSSLDFDVETLKRDINSKPRREAT